MGSSFLPRCDSSALNSVSMRAVFSLPPSFTFHCCWLRSSSLRNEDGDRIYPGEDARAEKQPGLETDADSHSARHRRDALLAAASPGQSPFESAASLPGTGAEI